MNKKIIDPRLTVIFPEGGMTDTPPRTRQPFTTTPACNNVMPFDLTRRARGGSRPGTTILWTTGGIGNTGCFLSAAYDSTHFIQHFESYPWLDGSNNSTIYLVIVAQGVVYNGTLASPPVAATNTSTGGNFSAGRRVEGTLSRGFVYMSDGLTYKKLELATSIVTDWTLGTGGLANMRLLTTYFDCVVLAQETGSPYLWQMARGGDPMDFDTGGTLTPDMPVTSNINWKAGQIGQAINALIPGIGNDLVFGLDHGLYRLVGHPMDGGIMQVISDSIGVLTPDGWDMSDRIIYFMGPMGFFELAGASVANLSMNKLDSLFTNLPPVGWHINVVFDRTWHGIWVFIVNAATPATQLSFWYDLRTGGFFPFSFANSGHAPTRAMFYDGNSNAFDSAVFFAGTDGYIRKWDPTVNHDDAPSGSDVAITSTVSIGPFMPGKDNFEQFAANGLWATLGDTPAAFADADFNCNYTLQFGPDPKTALTAPVRTVTGTWTGPGRQAPIGLRQAFGAMYVTLGNSTLNKFWAFEEIMLPLEYQGRVRS